MPVLDSVKVKKGQLILTDEAGNSFDVVDWLKDQGLHSAQNQLLTEILTELRELNQKMDEALS